MAGQYREALETGFSFRHKRNVIANIIAQMPCENPCLNEWKLSDPELLVQQRMLKRFLFSRLVGLNHIFPSRIGELNSAAFAFPEMFGAELFSIHESDCESVRKPGAEFFHQIQRKSGTVRAFCMEESDERVEAD